MNEPTSIDGILVQWGDRFFYPGNRIVKARPSPSLAARLLRQRANSVRARIEGTVLRRAPQVMVKVTGGGRGMKAIAAHFRYISKHGRLALEDDRGDALIGNGDLRDLIDDWRLGGTRIDAVGWRREAFNIMLSMPRGVDPLYVLRAAREFAREEFADHKYVLVLHDHQANPHVHLSVRAESRLGRRLNPRKADLQRWRATFAEKLRGLGIDAEASSRFLRGGTRPEPLWRIKARADGRLRNTDLPLHASNDRSMKGAWEELAYSLGRSSLSADRVLAGAVRRYANERQPGRDIAAAIGRD